MESLKRTRLRNSPSVLVSSDEYNALVATLEAPVTRCEIPIFDLEHCDSSAWVEQDDVWPQVVEVGLEVDLPVTRKHAVEEVEDKPLATFERSTKPMELVTRRRNDTT